VSALAAVVALAAVAVVAAGSVVSGSVPAQAARLALAAADRGERAACAKCHEQRRCDGRRTTSGLAHEAEPTLLVLGVAGARRRARLSTNIEMGRDEAHQGDARHDPPAAMKCVRSAWPGYQCWPRKEPRQSPAPLVESC
jgi:hypothetical protein